MYIHIHIFCFDFEDWQDWQDRRNTSPIPRVFGWDRQTHQWFWTKNNQQAIWRKDIPLPSSKFCCVHHICEWYSWMTNGPSVTVGPEDILPKLMAWFSPYHWVCSPACSPDIQTIWEFLFNSGSLILSFALTLLHLQKTCMEVLKVICPGPKFPANNISHLNIETHLFRYVRNI